MNDLWLCLVQFNNIGAGYLALNKLSEKVTLCDFFCGESFSQIMYYGAPADVEPTLLINNKEDVINAVVVKSHSFDVLDAYLSRNEYTVGSELAIVESKSICDLILLAEKALLSSLTIIDFRQFRTDSFGGYLLISSNTEINEKELSKDFPTVKMTVIKSSNIHLKNLL